MEKMFEVTSKVTGNCYTVYDTKKKRNQLWYYKIYNWTTDCFEWWFEGRFYKNKIDIETFEAIRSWFKKQFDLALVNHDDYDYDAARKSLEMLEDFRKQI